MAISDKSPSPTKDDEDDDILDVIDEGEILFCAIDGLEEEVDCNSKKRDLSNARPRSPGIRGSAPRAAARAHVETIISASSDQLRGSPLTKILSLG